MPEQREIPWVIEEHTRVKHQLLEDYVTVWMAIMFSQQARINHKQRLIYIDGFAGPGVYWDDVTKTALIPGSPVIVAQKANGFIEKDNTREIVIQGIDNNQKQQVQLQGAIFQQLLSRSQVCSFRWVGTGVRVRVFPLSRVRHLFGCIALL